jgi:hypothetical protein
MMVDNGVTLMKLLKLDGTMEDLRQRKKMVWRRKAK